MRGFLILDKPAGITSSKMLAPFRGLFRNKIRVGHAGTLDPFATGTLLVLLGDVTRLSSLAMTLPKTYETTVRFGVETDTLDPDGVVVREADPGDAAPAGLEAAVATFRGVIRQTPPIVSAIKVGGTRAYTMPRDGSVPDLPGREVTVHDIAILGVDWPDVRLRIRCGSGTYIRSIGRDLGAALGLPASLATLRRTAIGPFRADDGVRLTPGERLQEQTVADALLEPFALADASGITKLTLAPIDAMRLSRGAKLPVEAALEVTPTAAEDKPTAAEVTPTTDADTATAEPDAPFAGLAGQSGDAPAAETQIAVMTRLDDSSAPLLVGLGRITDGGVIRCSTILAESRRTLEAGVAEPVDPDNQEE